jgi:RNA-directed DNA polymerase
MIASLISAELGLSSKVIATLARSASYRYKEYLVPKRSGGAPRIISQPTPQLKVLQVWLVRRIFRLLPIHAAATAYMKHCSIGLHAALHSTNNFLLKVDFQDFFPSIKGEDVVRLLQKNAGRVNDFVKEQDDLAFIRAVVCRRNELPIGAPSSPIVSNAVMYDFDLKWATWCQEKEVTYSRYADDLCFSTKHPNVLDVLLDLLHKDLEDRVSPKLRINGKKTVTTSRKRKRLVTGIVLTPQGGLSLGRQNKRKVKAMVHQFLNKRLDAQTTSYLTGYLSFAQSIEPMFIEALRKKYGSEVIDGLRTIPPVERSQ